MRGGTRLTCESIHAYWFEQELTDVPGDDRWLSAGETAVLTALRIPKRRADWRLGRWTAKCAVVAYLSIAADVEALSRIEISPADCGAPEVWLNYEPARVTISISHSAGRAVCAVAPPGVALGCDLESIEARSEAFVNDYFTARELAVIHEQTAAAKPEITTLLWSAKESALKALRTGLRLDTRFVQVSVHDAGRINSWSPLQVQLEDGRLFDGWYRLDHASVRTLVACPATLPPHVPSH